MALNRARLAQDIGINQDMSFQVTIEYFDAAAPGVVIWPESFSIPPSATPGQLQAAVVARGQQVRTGLAALATAQSIVPNQTVVTVP